MPHFTVFKRPSRFVFLDDDALFLEILRMALPPVWQADLYCHAAVCIADIKANAIASAQDLRLQRSVLDSSKNLDEGLMSVIPRILAYWRHNPGRYGLVQAAIFDEAMPHVNGLTAFEMLGDWQGVRAILTGHADDGLAVQALNKHGIDLFVTKQHSPQFLEGLLNELSQLLQQNQSYQQMLWFQSLSPEQQCLLAEPTVMHGLTAWVAKAGWVEYVVTHAPFGILGVDPQGAVSWLQLERQSDLEDLACFANEEGLDQDLIAALRQGHVLVNTELCLALGLDMDSAIATSDAFEIGCIPDRLLGTLWALGEQYHLDPASSYETWLKAHPTQLHASRC
jgi:hypothetical protein